MRQYVKKPIVIEAIQFKHDDGVDVREFCPLATLHYEIKCGFDTPDFTKPYLIIKTLEGDMRAEKNDYIIKGIKGEFYPCKPDIFEASYDHSEPTMCVEPSYPESFDFGSAIFAMKSYNKVARKGWNGKGMYLFLANGEDTASSLFKENVIVDNFIVMKTASGSLQPGWLASQADMLADDWMIVEEK